MPTKTLSMKTPADWYKYQLAEPDEAIKMVRPEK
jgi:hypothetical protein